MSVNFNEILSRRAADIKPPAVMPAGTYLVAIVGQPQFGQSSAKKTPFVAFAGKYMQPMDDVDRTALAEVGGLDGKELKPGPGGLIFYITENSEFMLLEFLRDTLKIDDGGGDKSLKEMVAEAPGRQCLVVMKHESLPDRPDRIRSVVDSTLPV